MSLVFYDLMNSHANEQSRDFMNCVLRRRATMMDVFIQIGLAEYLKKPKVVILSHLTVHIC